MDTFIDKLAQKFSAQDMIRANLAAEAKETKKLREKMESYETLLQEMRQINLKNMESAERVNLLLQESSQPDMEYMDEMFTRVEETLHTENVKVYRNVQAAVQSSIDEQTKTLLEKQQEQMKELLEKQQEQITKQQEHIESQHKLIQEQGRAAKNSSLFLKIFAILTFLGVAAGVVLQVLQMMNFKLF